MTVFRHARCLENVVVLTINITVNIIIEAFLGLGQSRGFRLRYERVDCNQNGLLFSHPITCSL